ncbi:MAG: hypothetical protein R3C99_07780 [Pirellulaceae bacterium]
MSLFTDAMPPRATSLRAYRQMLGGVPEVAGESIGVSVSVVQSGPVARHELSVLVGRCE